MVIKAEAIYGGQAYELVYDASISKYVTEIEALKRELKTDQKLSYHSILLRVTDDAGNVTVKTVSDAEVGQNLLLMVRETDIFPMRFIIANSDGIEIGYMDAQNRVDMDIGNSNDFKLEISADAFDKKTYNWGHRLFIPETEYGGLLECISTLTQENTVTFMGYTWRGLLSKKIIEPPNGQTHLTVSGEANKIIGSILEGQFGSLFISDDTNSQIMISNYQFDRYCTMLDGFEKMLTTVGAKLKIYYKQGDGLECGKVHLCAVPITDWSDTLDYSQDSRVNFSTKDFRMGINHLICAGEGEGVDRAVIHLYVQKNGSIGDKQYYFGLNEREELYSYTSQEDETKLREDGTKRLSELINYKQFDVSLDDVEVDLNDIVGGHDRITDIEIKCPVVNKILKMSGDEYSISYKLKEGEQLCQ